jgi:hypothetical protein
MILPCNLLVIFLFCLTFSILGANISNAENSETGKTGNNNKLLIVWTSADREVALKMVFMYAYNSKLNNWWETIHLLVWGPSAKLLSEDVELKDYIKKMKNAGVTVSACKACSDSYGVTEKLSELGIDVKYMGQPLTEMLKNDWTVMTF